MTGAAIEVVVTGLGAMTPVGGDAAATWSAMLAGRSGVGRLDADWAGDLPVRIGAQVPVDPAELIERRLARRLDRVQQLALVTAREAWAAAGAPEVAPDRLAVVLGSGIGGARQLVEQWETLQEHGHRKVSPLAIPMIMPSGSAAVVGVDVGARAAVHAPTTACAAGADAIAQGLRLIRAGEADVVIAGGVEACLHPLTISAFAQLRALSTRNDEPERASRPFDKGRDGFVMGEGAGVVVLERAEFARARGADVHAVLAGAGVSADAFDLVQPDPRGAGASAAIQKALANAGLSGAEIQHVNAHGTSTPAGDAAEAVAIRAAIGEHAAVTATKSVTGHLIGAAGAVEAIATVLTIRDGLVPATLNLEDADDDIRLDIVTHEARRLPVTAAISNSFGFGGHNVALVFRAA